MSTPNLRNDIQVLQTSQANIGTLSSLTTTNKSSLVLAINENVTNVTNLSMEQMFPTIFPIPLNGLTIGTFTLTNIPVILGTVTLA
ncbi:MAG TPA: hypothetical protein VIM42_10320 [Clostridium sp.]